MGAVQKLATVVIIGLVALATVLVVYLAGEPIRRDDELTEQQAMSIERGTQLYITYCLQCHGPYGLGGMAPEEPRRAGAPLNQSYFTPQQLERARVVYQSDDPVQQSMAEEWIRFRVMYGVPPEPTDQNKRMPAFRQDLNVEELNDIVYLIMHGDWDYVYNTVVTETGQAVAEAQCEEDPSADICDNIEEAPPAYPTPPGSQQQGDQPGDQSAATPVGGTDTPTEEEAAEDAVGDDAADAESGAVTIEAQDPAAWSTNELTVKPGDTIQMTNTGVLQHDFTVDELGIQEVANGGESVTITIPEDAEPGEYEFYCSVPGHREQGMVGTLIIEG